MAVHSNNDPIDLEVEEGGEGVGGYGAGYPSGGTAASRHVGSATTGRWLVDFAISVGVRSIEGVAVPMKRTNETARNSQKWTQGPAFHPRVPTDSLIFGFVFVSFRFVSSQTLSLCHIVVLKLVLKTKTQNVNYAV